MSACPSKSSLAYLRPAAQSRPCAAAHLLPMIFSFRLASLRVPRRTPVTRSHVQFGVTLRTHSLPRDRALPRICCLVACFCTDACQIVQAAMSASPPMLHRPSLQRSS